MTEQSNNPKFTFINYHACQYCKHIAVGTTREGYDFACSKSVVDGHYTPTELFARQGAIDGSVGCAQLEASGLPIHPLVLERVIKRCEYITRVPVDPSATETSWDFSDKMIQFPHVSGLEAQTQ